MSLCETVTNPLPLDPLPENKLEDRRLWIGNLDPRITEYHLLKILQKYGDFERFDLLFHRSGPLAGQPRGYAFVTYKESVDAKKAKESLDGKMLGCKRVAVRWANSVSKEDMDKPKPKLEIPALAGAKSEKKLSREITIQAIEAKLKMMEHNNSDEFKIDNSPCGSAPTTRASLLQQNNTYNKGRGRHDTRPYKRLNNRR